MKYDINKYASINKLYEYYGPSVCANISKYHALTGCDTTSYFFNVGKTSPFEKMLENSESLDWISELGTSEECNEDIIENCMRFVKEIIYSGSWKETYVETRG